VPRFRRPASRAQESWPYAPLHLQAQMGLKLADEAAAILAISPHQLDRGKAAREWREQQFGPLLIREVGPSDLEGEQVAFGVDQCVSFATPDFPLKAV
jgi:hypothetical protein